MKKKGFTLIELLAVIVVLAIIALIATPIVMNVISNAQKGAAERSADNYVKAVETLIATKRLDGEVIEDGAYLVDSNGNPSFGTVELSGTKPNGGTITIKDGQVVKEKTSINVGDYIVAFEDGKAATKELQTLSDLTCYLEEGSENTVGSMYLCDLSGGFEIPFYVLEPGTSSKPMTLIMYWPTVSDPDFTVESWYDIPSKLDEIIATSMPDLDRSQIGIPSIEQIIVAEGLDADEYLEYPTLTNEWLYGGSRCERNQSSAYWTSTIVDYDSVNNDRWQVTCDGNVDMDVPAGDIYVIRPIVRVGL